MVRTGNELIDHSEQSTTIADALFRKVTLELNNSVKIIGTLFVEVIFEVREKMGVGVQY